jgi:hypothetical protein
VADGAPFSFGSFVGCASLVDCTAPPHAPNTDAVDIASATFAAARNALR